MKIRNKIIFLLVVIFIIFGYAGIARATTTTWTGVAGDGKWGTATNWDNGVPNASLDVSIASNTTINVNATGSISFNNLQVGGGSAATQNLYLSGNIASGVNITIANKGTVTQNDTSTQAISGDLVIQSGGLLTHTANGTTAQGQMYYINFSAANININSGGTVNFDYKGYAGSGGNGYGPGGGIFSGGNGGGGSNGGNGGVGVVTPAGNTYCNANDPALSGIGSSGSAGYYGTPSAAAGGMAILVASNVLTVNGTITGNGAYGGTNSAGSSGGTLKLVGDSIAGTPSSISLIGSDGNGGPSGAGGGGCALISYVTTNTIIPSSSYFSMRGGTAGTTLGGAGMVLVKQNGTNGTLYVKNTVANGTTTPAYNYTFDSLNLYGSAIFKIPTGTSFTTSLFNGDSTGIVHLYGTLVNTISSVNFYTLKVFSGGIMPNSTTLTVGSQGGLYLFQGAVLSNTDIANLSATGTLYLEQGVFSGLTNLTTAGTASLYKGFVTGDIADTYIINGGTTQVFNYTTTSPLTLSSLIINSGGTLSHGANGTTAQGQMHVLNVSATNITINSGGSINFDGKGYAGANNSNGNGPGGGIFSGGNGGGGSNGGNGGVGNAGYPAGNTYCNANDPAVSGIGSSGSAGYYGTPSGAAGGLAILNASNLITINNGTISGNGVFGGTNSAGSSGGSLKLVADTITGTPSSISLIGSDGNGGPSGAGGGGCALISYVTSNSIIPSSSYFSMRGSSVGVGVGGAGIVLVKQNGTNGTLYVKNTFANGTSTAAYNYTFDSLNLYGSAIFKVPSGISLTTPNIAGDGTGIIHLYGNITNTLSTVNDYTLKVFSGGTIANSPTLNVGSAGGLYLYAGAVVSNGALINLNSTGTLYVASNIFSGITNFASAGTSDLLQNFVTSSVANFIINGGTANLYRNFTSTSLTSLTINGGTLSMANFITSTPLLISGNLTVNSGGTLTHAANGTTAQGQMHVINITANNITITSGGSVNADGKGYAAGAAQSNGYGPGGGIISGVGGSGGGNGGAGGTYGAAPGGAVYLNLNDPAMSGIGSGGARWNSTGGAGGGLVVLSATNNVAINGSISANGGSGFGGAGESGGGSGGSVKIIANSVTGTPTSFYAKGGNSATAGGGGGGGVYVRYSTTCSISSTSPYFSVVGGTGYAAGSRGQALIKLQVNALVGYYQFDGTDVTTSTVADKSGQGNNGTISNGSVVDYGKIGQAFSFNGTNNISAPTNNFSIGSADRTISFWVKSKNTAVTSTALLGWGTNTANSASAIVIGPAGVANRKVSFYANGNDLVSNGILSDNYWNYITFVLSGTSAKLYINGLLDSSATLSGLNTASGNFYMGAFSTLNKFNGVLDEVQIYSRAMPASEVYYNYVKGVSKIDSSAVTQGGTLASTSTLMGYWTFDGADINSIDVFDKSGHDNTGSRTGVTKLVGGKIGQALSLKGTGSILFDYITNGTVLSRSAWIKTNYTAGQMSILDNYDTNLGVLFGVQAGSGKLMVYETSATPNSVTSNNSVADNKWHLVTFTNDGVYTRIYIDGALNAAVAQTLTSQTDTGSIGGSAGNFYGLLDDVRMYNKTLSVSEIKQLYKAGGGKIGSSGTSAPKNVLTSGLVGWWTFDGQDVNNTLVFDKSGNSNDGIRNGGLKPVAGKIGQAFKFDGSSAHVYIGDGSGLSLGTQYTVSARINVSDLTADRSIISLRNNAPVSYGLKFQLDIESANTFNFVVRDDAAHIAAAVKSMTVKTNKWYHVVGVRNGNNVYVYVDGVAGIPANASFGSITVNKGEIGALWAAGVLQTSTLFKGVIDDVRVYSRALSAKEVQQLFKNGTASKK